MNLASMVAELMRAEGIGGLVVCVRYFAFGEPVPPLDESVRPGVRTIDQTGRRDVAPLDPEELEARVADANAATVEGQREAMRASAADQEPAPERSIDPYRYVDLARERERRGLPAITIPVHSILDQEHQT